MGLINSTEWDTTLYAVWDKKTRTQYMSRTKGVLLTKYIAGAELAASSKDAWTTFRKKLGYINSQNARWGRELLDENDYEVIPIYLNFMPKG